MKKDKCLNCGIPKITPHYGNIWLSKDGYCSVCNYELKDRIREKIGMDKFIKTKIVKKGNYNHLNRHGGKLSNANVLYEKTMKSKQSNSSLEWKEIQEKNIKRIEDFI